MDAATSTNTRLLFTATFGLLLGAASAYAQPATRVLDTGDIARHITALTNRFRATDTRAPTVSEPRLTASARSFAEFMARSDRFDHDADGRDPSLRARAEGYTSCKVTENIAYRTAPGGSAAAEPAPTPAATACNPVTGAAMSSNAAGAGCG